MSVTEESSEQVAVSSTPDDEINLLLKSVALMVHEITGKSTAVGWPNSLAARDMILIQLAEESNVMDFTTNTFGVVDVNVRLLPLFPMLDMAHVQGQINRLSFQLARGFKANRLLSDGTPAPMLMNVGATSTVLIGDEARFLSAPILLTPIGVRYT